MFNPKETVIYVYLMEALQGLAHFVYISKFLNIKCFIIICLFS